MSTRGIYGFRVNETRKLAYSHADSYPDVLDATEVRATAFEPALPESQIRGATRQQYSLCLIVPSRQKVRLNLLNVD